MKHLFIFISFFFSAFVLLGQTATEIRIKILDSDSKLPVSGVHIQNGQQLSVSDKNGIAHILNTNGESIQFSHIAYCDTTIVFSISTASLEVLLTKKVEELPEAFVSNKPYEIFSPKTTHVFDYEFAGDTLLVLTYEREKMFRTESQQSQDLHLGCKLIVVSPSGNILSTYKLGDFYTGFFRDGLNQLFILGDSHATKVDIFMGRPAFSRISLKIFEEQIKPLNASSEQAHFFDDHSWDFPEFTHYAKSKITGESNAMRTIRDEFTMELFRAEYKYMSGRDKLKAIRLETETGIDKEIIGAYMSGFQHSLYYQPIYAPLFQIGDTMAIFDHQNNLMFFHDQSGVPLDSVQLNYNHRSAGKFDNQVIRNHVNDNMYAIYKKNGRKYLRPISLSDGSAGAKIELYYSYPDKIKVVNDRVYYIYRKADGRSTKHLYAENLR